MPDVYPIIMLKLKNRQLSIKTNVFEGKTIYYIVNEEYQV